MFELPPRRRSGGADKNSKSPSYRSRVSLTQLEDRTVPATAGSLDLLFGGTGTVLTDIQGGTDEAHAIAVDALGRYVVAGFTSTAVEEEDGGAPILPGGGPPDGVGGGGGGGEESVPNPLTDFAIVRYNSDGTLDTNFGTGGKVIVNVSALIDNGATEEDKAFGVAIQDDGKIVVSGYVNRGTVPLPSGGTLIDHDFAVVRLNSNGSLDSTFGTGGLVVTDFGLSFSDEALDVAIQPDGKIIAAGRTGTSNKEGEGATADFALARYNANGTLDSTFGTGGLVHADLANGSKDEGKRISLMSDGRIVMAGMSEVEVEEGEGGSSGGGSPAGGPDFAVARFNPNGSLDSTFGGAGFVLTDFGGIDEGQDVAVQPDGKPIVVGHVGEGAPADFGLVRYNLDGTLDTSFGTGGKVQTDFAGRADFPFAIGIQSDGKIVAAGRGIATTGGAGSSGAFQYAVARYNPNGTLDTSFGGDGTVLTNLGGPSPDQGYALAVQDDRIVVAGVAASDFGLAAYLPYETPDVPGGGTPATPRGPQFTVAAVTGSESNPPVVAVVNPQGDFVAAWESLGEDGSGIGVYAQAFEATGTPIGAPTLVNVTTAGNQSHPTIASDGNGNFIIAWQGEASTGGAYDVYYRTGVLTVTPGMPPTYAFSLTTGELPVNVLTTGTQMHPTAAMDADGRFVIAWQSDQDLILNPDPLTTTGIDIFARYGTLADGLLGTVDTPISTRAGNQVNPDAAMTVTSMDGNGQTASGQMVIVWTGVADPVVTAAAAGEGSGGPGGGGGGEDDGEETEEASIVVRGTVFTYNAAFGSVVPIDAAHTDYQMTSPLEAELQHDQVFPDVAINPSLVPAGQNPNRLQFVLTWQAEGQQGSGSDVFARRFDVQGNGLDAGNVLVNQVTSMPQRYPAVGIDGNGNYYITWQSQGVDSRSWGIMAQAFDAGGNRLKAEDFLVNVNPQGPQTNPGVAVSPDGKVVSIWAGPFVPTHGEEEGVEGEGGHQPGVFARLFKFTAPDQLDDVPPSPTAIHVNGLEFQLAEVGAGEDVPASAALLADGTYIVVWQAFEEAGDASGYGVYGQRVAADGTPIGTKFLINETTLGYQSNPSVADLSGGRFMVVWQGEVRGATPTDPSQYDVFGRIFTLDGDSATADTPVGGAEFQINNPDDLLAPTNQTAPNVASDGANGFVVVWQTDAKAAGELGTEIYARRYSSAGGTTATPLGDEFRVNTVTSVTVTDPGTGLPTNYGSEVAPRVAMNPKGEFAVVWVSDNNILANPADTEKSIFVRWFGASVHDQTTADHFAPEFLANVHVKDAQEHPAIAMDAEGKMVVAWQSINQETGGQGVSWGVFARMFNPDGTSPQGKEFQVNQTVNQPQRFPAVGMDEAGRFAIAWQAINQDGSSWGVYQRQYNAAGVPITGEEQVNTQTQGPQILPVFARSPMSGYAIFWSGGMAEHVDGVGGRVYDLATVPSPPNVGVPTATVVGGERSAIGLPITISAADLDVFERLSVVITGVPAHATLSAGTRQPDGSWVLTPSQLAGLTIRMGHEDTATLTITGIATEVKTDQQATSTLTITVTALNVDFFAAGQGDSGKVRQFGLDGTQIREIDAFPGFAGGVHVATGDVTGDGVPDIVAGAGPGGGPHVKVFDGKTGDLVRSFFAYDPSFTGGVLVAVGDLDGDGFADIVTSPTEGGGPHIKVFDGKTGAEERSFFAYDSSLRNGASVAVGDVTGDGVPDIVTGALAGGAPHVKVFDGVDNAEVRSFFAFEPSFMGGVNVAVGNVVGDGRLDIIAGPGPGGGSRVRILDGHDLSPVADVLAFDPDFRGGVRVGAVDQDGDGLSEVLIGAGEGGGPVVQVLEPLTLDILAQFMAFDPASHGGVWVG